MRIAIYTALVGGYDNIQQPEIVCHSIDYILFSNDIPKQSIGIWQVRSIDYFNEDKTRIARYVKTHPHKLLQGYDYCIWMDSNLRIKNQVFYDRIFEIVDQRTLVAGIIHPQICCVYDECLWIKFSQKDTFHNMIPQLKYLKSQGYPCNNGLCETNILVRNLQEQKVVSMCEDWWYMIDNFSKRDQLSFNYVLWKNHIPFISIFPKIEDTKKSPYYSKIEHKQNRSKLFILWRFYVLPLFYKPIFYFWHLYIKHFL